MKKKLVSLLLCAVMVASALTFAGCGNNTSGNTTSAKSETNVETEVSAATEAEKEAADLPDESGISSVNEFLATEEMRNVYQELNESLREQGLSFNMESTDKKLTYVYTYISTDIDKQATGEALAQSADETATELKSVYDALAAAGIKDPVVEYRFQASDGDVIYSQSYPEQAQ